MTDELKYKLFFWFKHHLNEIHKKKRKFFLNGPHQIIRTPTQYIFFNFRQKSVL